MNPSPCAAGSSSPTVPTSVRLHVRNLGHVPAKKNRFYANVDPRHREWQRKCVQSLQSQLRSLFQTGAGATSTTPLSPCLIALLKHSKTFDDNWRIIPEIHIRAQEVPDGEEGAEIVISLV